MLFDIRHCTSFLALIKLQETVRDQFLSLLIVCKIKQVGALEEGPLCVNLSLSIIPVYKLSFNFLAGFQVFTRS